MGDSNWILEKLNDERRQLKLTVYSEKIPPLQWVWTAEVSIDDGPSESTITIAAAEYTPIGMPDGYRTGSYQINTAYTNGIKEVSTKEFRRVAGDWEEECRQISSAFDASILRREEERKLLRAIEDKRIASRKNVETYLDALTDDSPELNGGTE